MRMKNLTATEAARHFADVLDAVEHEHETFVVTRGGRVIAAIGPAGGAGGRRLKEVMLKHRPDADWREELHALRRGLVGEERDWRG
jgi:prevent-host-death family protein